MKTASMLGALASLSLVAGAAAGPDVKATAQTLVNQCATIKQGDRVLIAGRPADLELLEEVAVNVRKLGAFPLITMRNGKLARRMYEETPAKFDGQVDDFDLKLTEIVNAMISVQADDNPGLFADVPAERVAARAKAEHPIEEAMLKKDIRRVHLGNGMFPTPATAKMYGLSEEQLAKIFWAGVNTDYSKLQNTGQSLQEILARGNHVSIMGPNGTNLTFGITSRTAYVSDGVISADDLGKGGSACQVWLPAGEVYITPARGTADGTVYVERMFYQGKEISGISLTFSKGKLTAMTAKSGLEPLQALYNAAGAGKEELAFMDIGINPDVTIPPESKFQSWVAAGTVTVGIGGNQWAGGLNVCPFTADFRLQGCTVKVGDNTIVSNGKLNP